jgi:hypothetical protein
MLRTSMRNVVRTTVLIVVVLVAGGIGSVAAREPLPNFQKLAASSLDGVVVLGQGK